MEQGVYPLLLDGANAGEVRVSAEGAWTVFKVDCAMRPGIVRVSVYGEGREGYLGVLAPEGERLTLCRRFSRSALREFPAQIEYAAMAGAPIVREDPAAPPEGPTPAGRDAHIALPKSEKPTPAGCGDPAAPTEPEDSPEEKDASPPGMEDLYWYASPDGALVCFDGTENLIALPRGDGRIPAGGGGWQKTIEGRAYVVFRTRDGRLVL